jgi:hypothetical protein
MPGAIHNYPRREKLVHLIAIGLEREYMTARDISEYFDCSIRTGHRLLNKLYDIQHELKYIKCEVYKGKGAFNPSKMKIRISSSYEKH